MGAVRVACSHGERGLGLLIWALGSKFLKRDSLTAVTGIAQESGSSRS